jgi:hypothetical protein
VLGGLAARLAARFRRRGLDISAIAVPVTPMQEIPPDEGDEEAVVMDLEARAEKAREGGGADPA